MNKRLFGFLMVIFIMVGCKPEAKVTETKSETSTSLEDSFKRAFSYEDYNFQLEYNNRLDTSYLDVLYKGRNVKRYGFGGNIKDDFFADMNTDKSNELYVVTGRGKDLKLSGFAFVEGKSIEIQREDKRKGTKAKSTSFKMQQNQLVERYTSIDSKGQAKSYELRYNLTKSKSDYLLLPEGWQPFELERIEGQFAARDASDAGYYKVLYLKNKGGGEWNVDIKVKTLGDKKILCHFNGNGYFLDKNLMVPMNKVNPELNGTLQIRFLDLQAIVYTEDQKDMKEMTSFCNGVGSIAGNFKMTDI